MREVKEHNIRKKEILDKAQALFIKKGYSKTTINDILKAEGIAKGTFYHYFKSKEEVMDALIMRFVSLSAEIIEAKANQPGKNAIEKMRDIDSVDYQSMHGINEVYLQLKHSNNAEMQYRIIVKTIRKISPIITRIIKQGVREGLFNTEYPQEFSEFLMVFSQFIFENDMLGFSKEHIAQRAKAAASFMESILGAKKGSLNFIAQRHIRAAKK